MERLIPKIAIASMSLTFKLHFQKFFYLNFENVVFYLNYN